jgi:hypothetical protein
MTYEQIRENWNAEKETAAKMLAFKYGLGFYLWPGYKGWCRKFRDGSSDASTPSITALWQALEKAEAVRNELQEELDTIAYRESMEA